MTYIIKYVRIKTDPSQEIESAFSTEAISEEEAKTIFQGLYGDNLSRIISISTATGQTTGQTMSPQSTEVESEEVKNEELINESESEEIADEAPAPSEVVDENIAAVPQEEINPETTENTEEEISEDQVS